MTLDERLEQIDEEISECYRQMEGIERFGHTPGLDDEYDRLSRKIDALTFEREHLLENR